MKKLIYTLLAVVMITACDKKNDDLVYPLKDFPQVIKFDDEGDGDLEDEDHFSFVLTLNDRMDPTGGEPAGKVVPLSQNVTVEFEILEFEGFDNLADYVKGWKAFYEIDDCTDSDDLPMEFDLSTGKGTVQFPAGVEEIEVEFETDDSFFDDDMMNEGERTITVDLKNVQGSNSVVVNSGTSFKYEVLDDETVHGDWELDASDAGQFEAFKSLFGLVNEDIAGLNADDVDKIEISIEYNEVTVVVELKETEMVEECGETEEVNKTIEIETEIEELELNTTEGDIETVGEVETDDSVKEFVYSGSYTVTGNQLELTLTGEYDDNESDEITLTLEK